VLLNIENLSTTSLFQLIVGWLLAALIGLHIITTIAAYDVALETKNDEVAKPITL
jgi:hypothetical protein